MAATVVPPPPDLSRLPPSPPAITPAQAPAPAAAPSNAPQPEPPTEGPADADASAQYTVVEDDSVRIEELKVRGRSQRIVVKPKNGPAYEIIPPHNGPSISQGARGTNGAAGKRVWPVLAF